MTEAERVWSGRRVTALTGLGVAMAIAAAGCGGGSSASTTTQAATSASSQTTASPPASSTSESTASSSTASSDSGLSGKWSGQYSGAYSGTFKLNWQESSGKLTGTIDLSPGGTQDVSGTVDGSSIKFGTVGGPGITYTGSVSGDSMSGNYQTPNGGGSWSASKSS